MISKDTRVSAWDAPASLPSRHAELLILCARIGFNP